jgi:hypothetical protein
LALKQQVESPVYICNSSILSQQGPLDALREQTLATQSYLSQHQLSSTLSILPADWGVCQKGLCMTIDSVNTLAQHLPTIMGLVTVLLRPMVLSNVLVSLPYWW